MLDAGPCASRLKIDPSAFIRRSDVVRSQQPPAPLFARTLFFPPTAPAADRTFWVVN